MLGLLGFQALFNMPGISSRQNGKLGGRPKAKHTLATEKTREFLVAEVSKKIKPLMTAAMDLALGYSKEVIDEDGNVRVYKVAPNIRAIQYLLDQAAGRATESIQVSDSITLVMDE